MTIFEFLRRLNHAESWKWDGPIHPDFFKLPNPPTPMTDQSNNTAGILLPFREAAQRDFNQMLSQAHENGLRQGRAETHTAAFEEGRVKGQQEAAKFTIQETDRIFNEGRRRGNADAAAAIQGRYPWREIHELTAKLSCCEKEIEKWKEIAHQENLKRADVRTELAKLQSDLLSIRMERDTFKAIADARNTCTDYQQGHDDGRVHASKEWKKRLSDCEKELSRVCDMARERQERIECLQGLNATQVETIKGYQKELDESNRVRSELCSDLENLKATVRSLRETGVKLTSQLVKFAPETLGVKPLRPEPRAGDVWRSPNSDVPGAIFFRHVHSVENGRVKYFSNGESSGCDTAIYDYPTEVFVDFVGPQWTVTRNAFQPARLPGEPGEGFAIDDVWTSKNGDVRTITQVSEKEIGYVRTSSATGLMVKHTLTRNEAFETWGDRIEPGAKLVRK